MDNNYFTFNLGEFIQVNLLGNSRIGRIHSVTPDTVSVTWWVEDNSHEGDPDAFYLPTYLVPTCETDVIPKPAISSLIFVFNADDIVNYKVRYVYGMKNIFASTMPLNMSVSSQSITYIIFDCISRISIELQRILSNRRGNQFVCSSSSVQISQLAWMYLVQKLGLPVNDKVKVCTLSTMRANDLSMLKIKAKIPCQVVRLENIESLIRLIAVLGNSAVVGVRKQLPAISNKIPADEDHATARGVVQLKDVINLVDVSSNVPPPPRATFSFNAQGRKGIDFIFFHSHCSLRISIRYSHFVVSSALDKLRDLGIAELGNRRRMNDTELEELIRG